MRNEPLAQSTRQMNAIYRWLAYHSVSGVVVNTKLAADQMVEMGYQPKRVHLVFNGIELPESSADSAHDRSLSVYGIRPGHRVVATVGNLQYRKNQHMFIDGVAQVLPKFPDVRCLIVGRPLLGEPAMQAQLEARIRELGLSDKIKLTGVRDDVPQLMPHFDVFCLTSRSEGMPNVMLEAMAAARPVVATRVGDIPHVIKDGDNGFLVASEDSDSLAQIITRLLEEPELATRIGLAGQATVEQRFSCEHMAREMENVYLHSLRVKCPGMVL
jgi:glycosyltransferase involved in cell wall biosynthesis